MSAVLTDFFTSLANKIRSKLGTSTTYTPAQAVSAIDDVYNAGVAAGVTTHTGTKNITTKTTTDLGVNHSFRYINTTNVANVNTGTKTITTKTTTDLGAAHSFRYIDTTDVANVNSTTYTFASGDTGAKKDLGAANTYRYVVATNVYSKGVADVLAQTYIPNLIPCLRVLSKYMGTFTSTYQLRIFTGQVNTAIATGYGSSGTSGPPSNYFDNYSSWSSVGYKASNASFSGFPNPYATFSSPYADFRVYFVNGVEYVTLFIAYKLYT